MNPPLFSIIVPTYGRPQYLSEALDSIRNQTIGDFECLVIDDASPTPATIPPDHRFVLIPRESNGGPAAAMNTGLDAARGRYVCFLDDDDLYTRDRLLLALEGLRRAPINICWNRFLDAESASGRVLEGNVRDILFDSLTPNISATTVDRSLADRFDVRFTGVEDVEWWLRVGSNQPVSTTPEVGYLIRRHEGPRNQNDIQRRIAGNLKLLSHHRDYFDNHRRAAAFRLMRIGLMASRGGDHSNARHSFVQSYRLHPRLRVALHIVRSLRPSSGNSKGVAATQ